MEARSKSELIELLRVIKDGYDYNPGSSDLDNEQPIHVSMHLGDYRKAYRLLWEMERPHE